MTPREQRHYDALQSMILTIAAMQRFHEYYISYRLKAEIDTLLTALRSDLEHIHVEAMRAEQKRQEGA